MFSGYVSTAHADACEIEDLTKVPTGEVTRTAQANMICMLVRTRMLEKNIGELDLSIEAHKNDLRDYVKKDIIPHIVLPHPINR